MDLIWAAFTCVYPDQDLARREHGTHPLTHGAEQAPDELEHAGLEHRLITMAREIGDRLVQTALPRRAAEAGLTWIGPVASATATRPWPPSVLADDLYAGRLGPALALARLGQVCGTDEHAETASAIFDTLSSQVERLEEEPRHVQTRLLTGALAGLGGLQFALRRAADHLDRPDWRRAGSVLAQLSVTLLQEEAESSPLGPDFTRGGLGVLAAVLRDTEDPTVRAAARELLEVHAADIVAGRVESTWWVQSGFAHGVAASLYLLARHGAPSRTRTAAAGTLLQRLEDFHDPQRGWLSRDDGQGQYQRVWCHGTAGLALALGAVGKDRELRDLDVYRPSRLHQAVELTLQEGLTRNLTFCHGDAGNLEILRRLEHLGMFADLPDDVAPPSLDRLLAWYSPEVIRRSLADRRSRYANSSSLLVGTSGVAYWLTHAARRELCPLPIIP